MKDILGQTISVGDHIMRVKPGAWTSGNVHTVETLGKTAVRVSKTDPKRISPTYVKPSELIVITPNLQRETP